MKLSKTDVEKVAQLARLKLSDAEIEQYRGQLSDILGYVKQLDEVDTATVAPTAQVTGLTNVLADDAITNQPRTELPSGVPLSQGTYIKVKAVFDTKGGS